MLRDAAPEAMESFLLHLWDLEILACSLMVSALVRGSAPLHAVELDSREHVT